MGYSTAARRTRTTTKQGASMTDITKKLADALEFYACGVGCPHQNYYKDGSCLQGGQCGGYAREALAEYEAIGDGWLDIKDAPKDGEYVLIANSDKYYCVAFWNGRAWDDGDFNSHINWATHWIPLPAPPKQKGGE